MPAAPHTESMSRDDPGCILFLIDQSGSMKQAWGAGGGTKAEGAATIINGTLDELVQRAMKGGTAPLDRYHVGVIGYGLKVGSAFGGTLQGCELVPISQVANNPIRLEEQMRKERDVDETGRVIEIETPIKFPTWIDPVADGETPMCRALRLAGDLTRRWVSEHGKSFPPIVVNITDGESTDGDPVPDAKELLSLTNSNGSTALMFNAHISGTSGEAVQYPESEEGLPDRYARTLFQISSELTPLMRELAIGFRLPIGARSRGFVFNAAKLYLAQLLKVVTQTESPA